MVPYYRSTVCNSWLQCGLLWRCFDNFMDGVWNASGVVIKPGREVPPHTAGQGLEGTDTGCSRRASARSRALLECMFSFHRRTLQASKLGIKWQIVPQLLLSGRQGSCTKLFPSSIPFLKYSDSTFLTHDMTVMEPNATAALQECF